MADKLDGTNGAQGPGIMQRNTIVGIAIICSLIINTGCAATIPLDANMRIDVDGASYSQHGMPLNQKQMVEVLATEPENGDRISSARTYSTASVLLAGAGGAAMGWPLGGYLAGDHHPSWWLAGVGGALSVTSIVLAVVSGSKVSDAVLVHNKSIDTREALERQEQQRREAPRPTKPLSPLSEGFGFEFEKGSNEAGALCRALGYQWTEKDEAFSCSSVPASEIENASAELGFADGHIVSLRIFVRPPNNAGSWVNAIRKTETTLTRMYGEPSQRDFVIPADCAGEAFMGCITSSKATGRSSWSKNPSRSVSMVIVNTPSQPMIVIDVKRLPAVTP